MSNRISAKFLRPNDVVRLEHRGGPVTGVVVRTYQSGGKHGARVVGTQSGFEGSLQHVDVHIKEGQILELLWREEEKAKSEIPE